MCVWEREREREREREKQKIEEGKDNSSNPFKFCRAFPTKRWRPRLKRMKGAITSSWCTLAWKKKWVTKSERERDRVTFQSVCSLAFWLEKKSPQTFHRPNYSDKKKAREKKEILKSSSQSKHLLHSWLHTQERDTNLKATPGRQGCLQGFLAIILCPGQGQFPCRFGQLFGYAP